MAGTCLFKLSPRKPPGAGTPEKKVEEKTVSKSEPKKHVRLIVSDPQEADQDQPPKYEDATNQNQPRYPPSFPHGYQVPANGQFTVHQPGQYVQRPNGNLGMSSGIIETRWKTMNHELPQEQYNAMSAQEQRRVKRDFKEQKPHHHHNHHSKHKPGGNDACSESSKDATAAWISSVSSAAGGGGGGSAADSVAGSTKKSTTADADEKCLSCGGDRKVKKIPRIGGGRMCFNCVFGAFGREATEVWFEGGGF